MTQPAPPHPGFGPRGVAAAIAGIIALSAAYGFDWYRHCHGVPLWMDEVLAVATARLPGAGAVVAALWGGAEYSPPGFDLALHALRLAGQGHLLRPRLLPGLALFGAALCMADLHRRRCGAAAVLAFGLVLAGGLFYFAVQARPYAPLGLCMALAIRLWFVCASRRAAAGLWVVCAAALCLHVFGGLVPLCIGLAEAIWGTATRRVRWPVWIALLALAPVQGALVPLELHLAHMNAADSAAPAFYATPHWRLLWPQVSGTLVPGTWRHVPVVIGLALAAILAVWDLAQRPARRRGAGEEVWRWRAMLIALAALPLIGFLAAVFVTGAFSPRYIAIAALLPALGLPYLLRDLPHAPGIAAVIVAALMFGMADEGAAVHRTRPSWAQRLILAAPASPGPIVIADGYADIALVEALPAPLRDRLVFVTTSPGIARADPTNENQLVRLAALVPHYRLTDVAALQAAHAPVLLLNARPDAADSATPSLRAAGWRFTPLAHLGIQNLWLATPP